MMHLYATAECFGLQVITETGVRLGWVKNLRVCYSENGQILMVVAPISIVGLPEIIAGAYAAQVELVSVGPDLIIVEEGSEKCLQCLTKGLLERVGIIQAPWLAPSNWIYTSPPGDDGLDGLPGISPHRPDPNPISGEVRLLSHEDTVGQAHPRRNRLSLRLRAQSESQLP
jgi:sporulation protein YlmC with PRC-barrel domain